MTLATAGIDHEPHAASVYFAADENLRLYFFSAPQSQHCMDLAHDSRAAATIHPECLDWKEIRGLQLRGEVHAVDPGPEWERAWGCYVAKFPFAAALEELIAANRLFVFVPRWVRLVDNRQGFGFKQEWELSGGGRP